MFEGFETGLAEVNGQQIAYRKAGSGPAILLLHGFPQCHAMWHAIAPRLAERYTVVAADLRGYGGSSKPKGAENFSFRHMAADQVALMAALDLPEFHVIGHDRGGRTAHRMALDHPGQISSLTVMDIVPTHHLLSNLTADVAKAYYHWFFLAQPKPFAENLIAADPDAYYENCLVGWGSGDLSGFDPNALAAYRMCWHDAATIRGMCDDYRAALSHDMALDAADLQRKIACPALVLYGAQGKMAEHYDVPATWAPRLADMQSQAVRGGHFFPDTNPSDTLAALEAFLSNQ